MVLFPLACVQDSQEFLRCLMDQLHEELKETQTEPGDDQSNGVAGDDGPEDDNRSQSENDFQSCESCGSSERADCEAQGGGGGGVVGVSTADRPAADDNANEAEMLVPERDEVTANRSWQKEKNMINDAYRSGVSGGGDMGADLDKDIDTAAAATTNENTSFICSQGALKVQGNNTGELAVRWVVCFTVGRAVLEVFIRGMVLILKLKYDPFAPPCCRVLPGHPGVQHHPATVSRPHGRTPSQTLQQPAESLLRLAQPQLCSQER